jgi:predicted membrane protein
MLNSLCPPVVIYIIFSLTQIGIDIFKGLYNQAFIKLWVSSIFTILLNYLCDQGLGIISWIIVFIPFILMTIVIAVLLLIFGLNPSTGKLDFPEIEKPEEKEEITPDARDTALDSVMKQQELQSIRENIIKSSSEISKQATVRNPLTTNPKTGETEVSVYIQNGEIVNAESFINVKEKDTFASYNQPTTLT